MYILNDHSIKSPRNEAKDVVRAMLLCLGECYKGCPSCHRSHHSFAANLRSKYLLPCRLAPFHIIPISIMSAYTGDGVYGVRPKHAQDMSSNVWEKLALLVLRSSFSVSPHQPTCPFETKRIVCSPRTPGAKNTQFVIVAAGGT